MRAVLLVAILLGGCYRPHPADGSFRCEADLGKRCPEGLVCNGEGLCVHAGAADMARVSLDFSSTGDLASGPRSCEARVREGAFTNLVALAAVNSAADESHIMLDPSGARLLFQRGDQLYYAPIDATDRKQVRAPQAMTIPGLPAQLHGGSFTSDGKLWLAGTDAGTTSLYAVTESAIGTSAVGAPQKPMASSCAFADPVFLNGDATFQLYVSYALAGCGGASYVVRGAADRNLGAFYSALVDAGWSSPSLTPSGLGLIVAATAGAPHLYLAERSDFQYQFTTAARISTSAIGDSVEDRQLVVSGDCRVAYFSSVRAGGAGGADLYAADILPQ